MKKEVKIKIRNKISLDKFLKKINAVKSEQKNSLGSLYGISIFADTIVPKDEVWMIDLSGKILKFKI